MEVEGNKHRQSSNLEATHAQSPLQFRCCQYAAPLEPPPTFKMAQELTFGAGACFHVTPQRAYFPATVLDALLIPKR